MLPVELHDDGAKQQAGLQIQETLEKETVISNEHDYAHKIQIYTSSTAKEKTRTWPGHWYSPPPNGVKP